MNPQTAQIVVEVQKQFDLRIGRVDVVKKKTRSHVYRLHDESRRVFLKLWIDSLSSERVVEEAALLAYLGANGFNAPTPVRSLSGENGFELTIDGARGCGYLTEEVGIEQARIDVENDTHLRMAARKLAEFHTKTGALGGDFTGVSWNEHSLIDRNLESVKPLLAGRAGDFDTLYASFERAKAHISQAWKKTEGSWGIVHGDWHDTNVVIGADGDVWFLDFESFGNGWRINDVVYLLGSSVETEGPLDLHRLRDRYDVFIEAYSKVAPGIGDVSTFPGVWLAVRFLLHLGRQIRELGEDGFRSSHGDFWVGPFMEKVDTLVGGSV